MDAVELNYPVDVAAPSFVGSDGFGRDRVTVMAVEVEACELSRVSAVVSSRASFERCGALASEKDGASSVNALDSSSRDKVPHAELCLHASELPSFSSDDVSTQLPCSSSIDHSWIPRPEEVQVQRKAGKASRSSSGCPKRPRIGQLEDNIGPVGVDDTKDFSDKLGSYATKSDSHEKSQLAKQKNNFSSKRSDRRNFKASMKTKHDSFSVKAGLASFSYAAGGHNFFGLYGLKTDVHDITKLVDDLSLNDLLDGTYECPSLGKDKGKKGANTTENILLSVRKACSILQLPRPVFQSFAEIDNCSNEKIPTCPSNSVSMVLNGDHGDSSAADLSISNKDSCSKHETRSNLLDFSFDQPKDTLECLALPPPKDLDSLLLDAAKAAVSSRNVSDQRPGKQISRRPSLPMPPFPWSHNFNGHCRTNSDSVKIVTSKVTCQGRWVRIGNIISFLQTTSNCFSDLESLTYDGKLVPSHGPKLAVQENNNSISSIDWASAAAPLTSDIPQESGGDLKYPVKVEHCPRLMAAAQTLYDIATHTLSLNQDGIMRWPKKPAQKAMKARKSKSSEKHEDIFAASTSLMGSELSDHMARSSVEQIIPSKRLKLSVERKKDLDHVNDLQKGPINWSAPKSSRSSPNKLVRDSIAEARQSTAYIIKQSCVMPPPAKVLHRTCNGQQKVRKLMQMDWSKECNRRN